MKEKSGEIDNERKLLHTAHWLCSCTRRAASKMHLHSARTQLGIVELEKRDENL